jgi:predicted TPR repeat methyltransferase
MAEALLAAEALPAAVAELDRTLRLDPGHEAARLALGRAWLAVGEAERAKEILSPLARSASPLSAEAETSIAEADAIFAEPRAAPGYVRHLFDQFSADYDARMLENLSYRAPGILRGLADMLLGVPEHPLAILDLGCGTGLAGEAFKDMAGRLDGIDLSPKMLAKARARGIYESLVVADLETALREEGPCYDLLLAADTLVYLGDLANVFAGAARRLIPGGFFLFTAESMSGKGFACGPKRRYRHSEAYLREAASEAGLEVMGLLECSPRDEAGQPVEGFAAALQRV